MAELVIIGSGTGIPSLKRASPATLIVDEDLRILIDSGSGTLRGLLKVGATYANLDLLLYTHIHPDHITDLVPILFACKYSELPRQTDLSIIGGPGFESHFEKLKGIYGKWIEPQYYNLTIKELVENALLFKTLKITSKSVAHNPEIVGYRIQLKNGKSITLSGDTDYCYNIVSLASDTDILILECSFPDEMKVEGHLTPDLAGRIASESHSKKLILTHLYPVCDRYDILGQCRNRFNGEIVIAEDLMRVTL